MTRPALFAGILACLVLLGWAWLAGGYWIPAGVVLVLGALWMLGESRRWRPAAYLGLLLAALGVGAGEVLHLAGAPLFLALACALVAWDLSAFEARLGLAASEDDLRGLELRHFGRLGVVLAAGVGLGLLALQVHTVRFKFELAALLVLLGIWGLSLLVGRLRQRGE